MISTHEAQELLHHSGTVVATDDSTIGSIGQVFLDDETGEPTWLTVRTGLFGGAESFVPLHGATVRGNSVQVAFDQATIQAAPRVDDDQGHLSAEDEQELHRYYGLGGTVGTGPADVGRDTSGATDDAMTRSEEQLVVGTERVRAGTARLRKLVVTEQVARTVPLRRDQLRIEREPLTADSGVVPSGGELSPAEHEVVLTAERVVVDKEVVPVERVRLGVESVTEQREVTEEVRRERIEVDGGVTSRGTDDRGDRSRTPRG
jgi:uncharacterized protein (TIGR02271 family)